MKSSIFGFITKMVPIAAMLLGSLLIARAVAALLVVIGVLEIAHF